VKTPKPQPVSRREARRTAVFVLYQWDVTETPLGSLHEGEFDDYTRAIAEAVAAHAPELDAKITAASDDWTADRLGAVERNILRIAVHELDAGEIPPRVVIDEAVTLAKQYSTREAGRLVNGILDRIYKEAA
jgi:N utilization substance protein B